MSRKREKTVLTSSVKSVKITKVSDQDSTDFMKCVALLNEKEKERGQIVRPERGREMHKYLWNFCFTV